MSTSGLVAAPSAIVPAVRTRISWGAVLVGGLVAIAVHIALALLGAAIGLAALPGSEGATAGMAGLIWWGVSILVALGIGAFVAGLGAGRPEAADGVLHGLAVWALTFCLAVFMLASGVGSLIGGTAQILGSVGGGATEVVARAAQGAGANVSAAANPVEGVFDEVFGAATGRDPASLDPAAARRELITAIPRILDGGPEAAAAKDRAVAIAAAQFAITPQEAEQRLDQAIAELRSARDQAAAQARAALDQAQEIAATSAVWGSGGLLAGALVAIFAGMAGARRNDFA